LQLPFFYINEYDRSEKLITLDDESARHIVQVLRMQTGRQLHLTDGKGNLITAEISDAHKRHCTAKVVNTSFMEAPIPKITIAISLLKNNTRFEWFLEKVTEIGIAEVVPLICSRTEKQKIRLERMQGILQSAMLQSRQQWLPKLSEPVMFQSYIEGEAVKNTPRKFIAHCVENEKSKLCFNNVATLILIGPEGDFTATEIEQALNAGCSPVSLGINRLRTETAGVVAATLLKYQ